MNRVAHRSSRGAGHSRLPAALRAAPAWAARRSRRSRRSRFEESGADRKGRNVLILVQNASVPRDQRVWQEARSLRDAGYGVTVVCPMGQNGDSGRHERRQGIEIHRYPARPANGTARGYFGEYASALWHTSRLVRSLARTQSFDVVHACNPPDLLLVAALPLKRRGARFVFDHHDLVPELYRTRFGRRRRLLYLAVVGLEWLSFRIADVVLATNESYREVAVRRGRKSSDSIFVVRNGPDAGFLRPATGNPELKADRAHLIAYVGVMAPQDGVDHALRALALLRDRRDDWRAVFAGDGDSLPSLRRLAVDLGLDDSVEFTGFLGRDVIRELIASADVCLAPEPSNPLNDVSTMIKVVEYMAMGRPIVSYDLAESRVSAANAALYAPPNDDARFADCIAELLDDPERRRRMGAAGRARVEDALSWEHSERHLLSAYARALAENGNSERPQLRKRNGAFESD
jgi:glycosyltransferase involved in cell wall biosynthesis